MTADLTFHPRTLRVRAGETVSFVNQASDGHTVTARQEGLPDGAEYFASGGFSSEAEARREVAEGLVDPGARYEVSFERAGTYRYYCIPHEDQGMMGTIVVEDD